MFFVWCLAIIAVGLAVAAFLWRPRCKASCAAGLTQAKQRFHVQRERLEAKFIQLAAAKAKPEAPRWADCTFADDVSYVRNRATGEISAFVAVAIASEPAHLDRAGQDSTDTDPDADKHLQAGTAVFRFDHDHWETDGRAILNLSPNEAVTYYRHDWEIVGEELAHR